MDYVPGEPPVKVALRDQIDDQFRALSVSDARLYFKWFVSQIPTRIGVLTEYVRSNPAFSRWESDGSDRSFAELGEWFSTVMTVRKRNATEIEAIYAQGPAWFRDVEVADWDLSEQTYSLCSDIGMYFGQTLVDRYGHLEWHLVTRAPRSVDIHQPVVRGFGKNWLNPVRVTEVLATGLHKGTRDGACLLEGLNVWSALARGEKI